MPTPKYATIVWPEHLKGQQVEIVNSPAENVFNTILESGESQVFHADNLEFLAGRPVSPDSLNGVMEFDHVIRVHEDGTVSDSPLDPYFDLHVVEVTEGHWEDEFSIPDGWELLTGFTGQYGYSGPVMHSSEFIGGGMARHILETPGDYVALTVESYDSHQWETDKDGVEWCSKCGDVADDGNTDKDATCPGAEPAGWAVAFKPLEDEA